MPLHPPGSNPADTMDEDLAQLVTLERLGFEEAWIGEHFTAQWENIPCPDLFIARALGMTKKMKLATGVSCLPNHDPLMLAQRIAQLDQMARGRFYWGVGSGGFPGDGKPKPVAFPDPAGASVDIGGIRYLSLEKLVELKLASGMTNPIG